jgi:hypothetical protein
MTDTAPNANASILALAQQANLLDPGSATSFSKDALATPHVYVEKFAQTIQGVDAHNAAQTQAQALAAEETLTDPEAIVKRLHHIVKIARAAGYNPTLTPNAASADDFPVIGLVKLPAPVPAQAPSTGPTH